MSFTWQHGRELAGFTKAGTTASYSYNDSGIRTKKVVNGVTTEYYLNGSTILTQITGDERLDFLYDDAGSLLGLKWNGTAYWYVKNLQGDIIGILDSDGTKVVNYVYDTWGQVSLGGTPWNWVALGELNPFRYRGYYFDQESGLYYLNSRYYDPEICRFLNADGYVDTGMGIHSQNMFVYCINNPVSLSDPSGTFPGYHYATLFGAQRAYEIYISKHPDAADYIVKYHMEGEDYGYYEGHPYSATWVYELIGPWTIPQNPPKPSPSPATSLRSSSVGKYDLGGGLKARVDAPHYNGGKKHIHVYYKGKEYSQNDNGSTSHKSGPPPASVIKILKEKIGWDWNAPEAIELPDVSRWIGVAGNYNGSDFFFSTYPVPSGSPVFNFCPA